MKPPQITSFHGSTEEIDKHLRRANATVAGVTFYGQTA
jgi:hypothetical protein